MVEKPEENQNVNQHSELIVVSLSYHRKIILEISDGFKLLEILARGTEVEEEYGKSMVLKKDKKEDITIRFITRQKLREMILQSIVEPEEKP